MLQFSAGIAKESMTEDIVLWEQNRALQVSKHECFDDGKAARRAEKQSLKVARNVELAMTSQTW
jgi:hypothetical protein